MNTSQLVLGVLFGSIGFGFVIYGKKQKALIPFFCGLTLMVIPYFITSTLVLTAVCLVLVAVPYFVRV
jgi:hypothetical protein